MIRIRKVYIASPLFNPKEKEENEEIDKTLREAGFDTFLPQRDGLLFIDLVKRLSEQGNTAKDAAYVALRLIAYLDIYQVCEGCDAAVLNMNGRVPDEGAVSEAALAFRSERPLVIYKDDARSLINGVDNPLITGLTRFAVARKISEIPEFLKARENEVFSDYSEIMKVARDLFGNYDSANKQIEKIAYNMARQRKLFKKLR